MVAVLRDADGVSLDEFPDMDGIVNDGRVPLYSILIDVLRPYRLDDPRRAAGKDEQHKHPAER